MSWATDQAQIARHGKQEKQPESAAVSNRITTPGDIHSGNQPQQAAETEKYPAGLIDAEFAAQQQPGQRNRGADR